MTAARSRSSTPESITTSQRPTTTAVVRRTIRSASLQGSLARMTSGRRGAAGSAGAVGAVSGFREAGGEGSAMLLPVGLEIAPRPRCLSAGLLPRRTSAWGGAGGAPAHATSAEGTGRAAARQGAVGGWIRGG